MILTVIVTMIILFWYMYMCNQENYMDLRPERFVRRNSSYDLRGDIFQEKKEFAFNNSELSSDNLMYRNKDGDY